MSSMPFGSATLVIPFEMEGGAPTPPRVARMSRMRPAGELFRGGVAGGETGREGAEVPEGRPQGAARGDA